ncbi:MAG: iron-sulfur cluster assembly protein [Alphaproteobacteria bacterium]
MSNAEIAPQETLQPQEPPLVEIDRAHPFFERVTAGLRTVYDPEIPVNIYELGLIYFVDFIDQPEEKTDLRIVMTLTSPNCPVAEDMPDMVRDGVKRIEGIGEIKVEITWEPPYDSARMSETAKLDMGMF